MPAPKHRSPLRRATALAARILGGLLCVLLLAVAGAFIWLRTDSAARFIADTTANALEGMGLRLTVGGIEGPLPGRLAISGLVLADEAGPLVKADGITLETDLAALFGGSLSIPLARVDGPELIRLPVLPPDDTPDEAPSESGGMPAIPVDIILKEFAVTGGTIHTAALLPPPSGDVPGDNGKRAGGQTTRQANGRADLRPGAEPAAFPERLSVALSGSAALRSLNLDARVTASLSDPGGQGVSVDLSLASGLERLLAGGAGKADELDITVTANEATAGPVAALLGMPGFPGYALRVSGSGPVNDWKGALHLALGSPGAPVAEKNSDGTGNAKTDAAGAHSHGINNTGPNGVGADTLAPQSDADKAFAATLLFVDADFSLRCATGSFWHDLVAERDFDLALDASAKSGGKTPPPLLPILGDALRVTALVDGKGSRLGGQAALIGPALELRLADLLLAPRGDSAAPVTRENGAPVTEGAAAAASLTIRALDMPALLGLSALGAAEPAPAPILPLSEIALTADIDALLASGFVLANVSGTADVKVDNSTTGTAPATGPATSQTTDQTSAGTTGETFSAAYAVSLTQEAPLLALRSLNLNGLGLRVEAGGSVNLDTLAANAKANVTAADNAPWQELITRLVGLAQAPDGSPPLGGSLSLAADLHFPGLPHAATTNADTPAAAPASPPPSIGSVAAASGSVVVRGENMRWPSDQLAEMLGDTLDARLRLDGEHPDASGIPSAYRVRLEDLSAGIFSASGEARFAPGNLTGVPSGSSSPSPGQAHGEPGSTASAALEAAFTASVSDLKTLAGAESGVSGPFSLTASADGPLDALRVALRAGSPAVTTASGAFKDVSFSLTGTNTLRAGTILFEGAVQAALADSPGGPLSLSGDLTATVPPAAPDALGDGEPLIAEIRGFTMQGAGLSTTADLSITAPPPTGAGPAAPELRGTLKARVHDWAKLAALTGATLSGQPATLDVRLDNASGRQSASAQASLPRLLLKEPDQPPTLRLQDVTASLAASDIFGAPSLDLTLHTGRGKAAFLTWNTGEGSVKGSGGRGEFSLALRQDRGRSPNTGGPDSTGGKDGAGGKSGASGKNRERLTLAGRYDLSGPSVLLNTFALRDPRAQTGLELAKPATLDLGDGIALKNLDVSFLPGGKLTAEAAVKPESMTARLDLVDLPFDFFALFTQATLPDGTLSAKADIRTGAGGPQGAFSVDSVLSATADVTGISKSGASPAASSGVSSGAGADGGHSGDAGGKPPALTPNTISAPGSASALHDGAFALHIDGRLGADPGPTVIAGSGVRALPGRVWLRGDGSFGSANKTSGSREGGLAFQIPLLVGANGVPAPDNASPMTAGVRYNGQASVLWQAVPVPDRYLNGLMRLEASVFGPMSAPKNRVRAYLAGGRFEDVINGVLISGINLEVKNDEKGDISALVAADDGRSGHFALQADVTGLQGGTPNLKARGQLKEFRPLHRDDLDIVLTGILGVNGPADNVTVTGAIAVEQGEALISRLAGGSVTTLDVTNRYAWSDPGQDAAQTGAAAISQTENGGTSGHNSGASIPGQDNANAAQQNGSATAAAQNSNTGAAGHNSGDDDDAPPSGPALDIKVSVPQYFFIRGMGLESEWQGELSITGAASQPSLRGSLNPVRGYFDIFSRTFEFTGGEIAFAGGKEINPALSLELTYEGPDVTALIKTGGTAKSPKLNLESRPPLPQDEVLARVLFGKRTSDLSRFEAIQLANNMRELTGFGGSGFDMLSGVRKQFGLDMLRIGGTSGPDQRTTSGQSGEGNLTGGGSNGESDAGAPALEAGKYINDSIYVGVEQGATEDSTSVRVEVELYPRVTLEGKSSSDTSEVGIGWKMDY